MNIQELVEKEKMREDIPEFQVGDTVKVYTKIFEGGKERVQVFEGIVIRRRGGGLRETFTVRRSSHGEGVERIFPLHAPIIEKIEVTRKGRVRRAKLYYLRKVRGKKLKVKEKTQRREVSSKK